MENLEREDLIKRAMDIEFKLACAIDQLRATDPVTKNLTEIKTDVKVLLQVLRCEVEGFPGYGLQKT